jgi:DNA replication protein DnaC
VGLARADGSYVRLRTKLARVDLLVIDDWVLQAPLKRERRDLLESTTGTVSCHRVREPKAG